jgi:hypothetical protein
MRTVNALLRHELRMLVSLALWVARRTHGSGGGREFGYTRGQGPMAWGLACVCVIETVAMSVLLRGVPAAHAVMLAVDVYTVVFVVGLHAASVVRPHVLGPGTLRVRQGLHADLCVPLERISSVRRELRTTHQRTEGELDLPVGSRTSITLELAEPVTHVSLLGRCRSVRTVRLHADDADGLVRALAPETGSPR